MLNNWQALFLFFLSSLFCGGCYFSIGWEFVWSPREVYKRICEAIRNEGDNSRRRGQDFSISALTAFQAFQVFITRGCAVDSRMFSSVPDLNLLGTSCTSHLW